jgi:hypothetical protein
MPADIVKASNISIFVAENDERIRIHFKREIVTWPGYLAGVAGKEPACAPDALDITAVNGFAPIELAWQ